MLLLYRQRSPFVSVAAVAFFHDCSRNFANVEIPPRMKRTLAIIYIFTEERITENDGLFSIIDPRQDTVAEMCRWNEKRTLEKCRQQRDIWLIEKIPKKEEFLTRNEKYQSMYWPLCSIIFFGQLRDSAFKEDADEEHFLDTPIGQRLFNV